MKPTISIFVTFFLLLTSQVFSQDGDIEIIKKRLFDDAINNMSIKGRVGSYPYVDTDFTKGAEYLASLKSDGSWTEVDYKVTDNTWLPLIHLDRLVVMATGYFQPNNALYQNAELLAGIENALAYWYQENPTSENWYKNDIAKQFYLNVLGILLEGKIDNALHGKIVGDLTSEMKKTGSDRTLLGASMMVRGVLENNTSLIRTGTDEVKAQLAITTGEGLQIDYTYHDHGAQLYNGTYGFKWLRESIFVSDIVQGTDFAFESKHLEIVRNFYLEGMRWMIRGATLDMNVRGREVGRTKGLLLKGIEFAPQLSQLINADPANAEKYRISKENIENGRPQDISGNRHYWRSDYTVHHRSGYFTSLKMCSDRTIGTEIDLNGNNMLGYWLPYGLTYIYKDGLEFQNIRPVWDWGLMPGVTNPHIEISQKGTHTQTTTFVGTASSGVYGVSAMDFSKQNTQAKKSWFWFDDEWVALGTGIQSTHASNIITGINQMALRSAVVVDGRPVSEKSKTLTDPSWVLHDNVGYVFPQGGTVKLKADTQTRSLRDMFTLAADTTFSMDVFSLWLDHGTEPKDGSYQYIVVPVADAASIAAYAKDLPVSILSNTVDIQAVSHPKLKIAGAAFYKAGEISIGSGITIAVDQPAIVLADRVQGTLSVSEPTGLLASLNITVTKAGGVAKKQSVTLPTGELAGKSVQITDLLEKQR